MKLLKEWNDVEVTTNKVLKLFNNWRMSNLVIIRGEGRTLEDKFGFPYTSSSDFAAIWNCQGEAEYRWNPEWRFEAIAVNKNNEAVAIFEHEDGTVDKLDRMYVIIGRV